MKLSKKLTPSLPFRYYKNRERQGGGYWEEQYYKTILSLSIDVQIKSRIVKWKSFEHAKKVFKGAVIDQWIRLRLPSCGPGFEPPYALSIYLKSIVP